MKLPINMIKDYVDINISAKEYAAAMQRIGTAVEGVEEVAGDVQGVVVGKIVTVDKHPNADALWICKVDIGARGTLQIVTGAKNIFEGAYVPVAVDGATLPGGKTIRSGNMRGEVSEGMLCSGPELNVLSDLYPNPGEEGILIFHEAADLGADVKPILGIDQTVIDFEILANRPDCLCAWGIARESAAALGHELNLPEIAVNEAKLPGVNEYVKVDVMDDTLCPRFAGRVIDNVRIAPSPMWLKSCLHACGVRSINNIVDITNFVMLETGHPMHAYDLAKVRNHHIIVRRANDGETMLTLDGKERELSGDMLVIADETRATGLAGVMGGEESEITESTSAVMFECAAFDRTNIRVTSRGQGLRTEASARFERGVCAATVGDAINRACQMVNILDAGDVAPGMIDIYPHPQGAVTLTAGVSGINKRVGLNIPAEFMIKALNSLQISASVNGDALTCEIPPYRADIENEADLSEEVLRLYGYENITSTLMNGATMLGKRSPNNVFMTKLKGRFVALGAYEVIHYSFISKKALEALNLPQGDWRNDAIALINPLGEDNALMRTSLAPAMLEFMSSSIHRGIASGKLFELAPVYQPTDAQLPNEIPTLCLGEFGDCDFYSLKDDVLSALNAMGIFAEILPGASAYYHPGRGATLTVNGEVIGELGEIHPDTAAEFDINARVYVAELRADMLMQLADKTIVIKPPAKYPAVSRDIALVMDETEYIGRVLELIRKTGDTLIEDARMFDIYRGAQLPPGKKSVAFALTFRLPDRTLAEGEVNDKISEILSAVKSEYGAILRA